MTQKVDQAVPAADEVQNGAVTPANEQAAAQGGQQQPASEQQPNEQEAQQQEPQAPRRTPWFERRIDELTAARRQAERERDAMVALLQQRQGQHPAPDQAPQQAQPQTQQPTPRDPYEIAQEIAASNALNERANEVYRRGTEAHPDFQQAVQQLQQVTDLSARRDFLEAVTSLPNAEDVYHHLGTNPDEAAHVLALPPMKMALELASLSAKVGRPKPQSKAPAPITPVGKSAAPSSELDDGLTTAEWIARREAQLSKRRG